MSRNLSLVARRAINAQQSGEVFLELLTINHADFSSPIRVVNNTESVTSGGETYLPFPFKITLPPEGEGEIRKAKISIDAVDREIIYRIRQISTSATVDLRIILASQPDTVEAGPYGFSLQSVSYTAEVIEGDLIYDETLALRYPVYSFDPYNFPGLF